MPISNTNRFNIPSIIKPIYFVCLILLIFNVVFDFYYTSIYGGVDLRDKIVGARILFTEYPMYYSWWTPEYPVWFLNPFDDLRTPLSQYTGTPFQSLFFYPLAQFNYNFIRYFWTVMHYVFIGFLFYGFYKRSSLETNTLLLLSVLYLVFFINTEQWHMHVERGQFYLFFAFLHGLIYFLLTSTLRYRAIAAGIVLGLLILFKPPYIIFAFPFVLKMKFRLLTSTFFTVLLLMASFFAFDIVDRWPEYFEAMKEWQKANINLQDLAGDSATMDNSQIPKIIEGNSNLMKTSSFFQENASLQKIVYSFTGASLPSIYFYAFGGIVILILLGFLVKKIPNYDVEELLLLGFLIWTITTMCMPAPRFPYQYIHWIVPISIVAVKYKTIASSSVLFIFIGLVLNLGIRFFMITIPYVYFIGELFLLLGLFLILLNVNQKLNPVFNQ